MNGSVAGTNPTFIREIEGLGMGRIEALILDLLLEADDSATIADLSRDLSLPRNQIYSSLKALARRGFVEEVSLKPRKYTSDIDRLRKSFEISTVQFEVECDAFRRASLDGEERTYQELGIDEIQKRVHQYLLKNPAGRTDISRDLSLDYEKARSIAEHLVAKGFVQKRPQGKSFLYIGIPVNNAVELHISNLRRQLEERRQRIEKIVSSLHVQMLPSVDKETKISVQSFEGQENVRTRILESSSNSIEVLSTIFATMDDDFSAWREIAVTYLEMGLTVSQGGVRTKWLVDRSFLLLFKELSSDLAERVVRAHPAISIKVVDRPVAREIIVDERDVFEFSQSTQLLEKVLKITENETARLKRVDFYKAWEQSHDFLPLIREMVTDQNSLVYFRKSPKSLDTYNIAFVGNKGVGKTSLVQRMITSRFNPYIRFTLGILVDDIYVKVPQEAQPDNIDVKLVVYDFAGQELFRDLYRGQLSSKQGFILVFSVDNRQSFDDLELWIKTFDYEKKKVNIFLVGSKCDLESKIDRDMLWDFRKKYRIEHYFETSALTGQGVQKLFTTIAENLRESTQNS